MKNILLAALAIAAFIVAMLTTPLLFPPDKEQAGAPVEEGLPWQIEILPGGGSKVFGLTPGASTLDDALARLGSDAQIAIVAAPGEAGALEAYWERASAGFVTGKMILTLDIPAEALERMRQRSAKTEYMESATRKSTLHPDDRQAALVRPIAAITFIPAAHLDEPMVIHRFGPPAERIRSAEHTEHFLYPGMGLDVRLDAKGREVLQYVAPREFARLRDPLLAHKNHTEIRR
ncbi:MAG: hypothetical protein Q8O34_06245 [Rhodocyclaceae bacterium]|nr:hypothetical protein [Rhodocyclaceae bacterium]